MGAATSEILNFLSSWYFHRIYTIPDEGVLNLALKSQKSKDEKQTLFDYYTNNREKLVLKVPIRNFWNKFTYIPAEQFDVLQQAVIKEFSTIVDEDTAKNLYYPNARIPVFPANEPDRYSFLSFKTLLRSIAANVHLLSKTERCSLK